MSWNDLLVLLGGSEVEKRIKDMHDEGKIAREIANALNLRHQNVITNHLFRMGLVPNKRSKDNRGYRSTLSDETQTAIAKEYFDDGVGGEALAEKYGVSDGTILAVVAQETGYRTGVLETIEAMLARIRKS